MFDARWEQALRDCDNDVGIDWSWLSIDRSESPLGGGQTGPDPTDRGELGTKRGVMCEAAGIPVGVASDGASGNDCKLAEATIESVPVERSRPDAKQSPGSKWASCHH